MSLSDLSQALPEVIFKADAGLVTSNGKRMTSDAHDPSPHISAVTCVTTEGVKSSNTVSERDIRWAEEE
jgi:hypothetical protein